MNGVFSSILATLITIPVLVYFLVFVLVKQITKKHRKAVHLAIDVTTAILILSVHFTIVTIWNLSLVWAIILVMLVLAIMATLSQWRMKGEVHFSQLFRSFWRVNFLVFFSAYLILLIIGVVISVTHSVS